MNHQIIYQCYYAFAHRGIFRCCAFKLSRSSARSQGIVRSRHRRTFRDAANRRSTGAQTINPEGAAPCWVAGFLVRRLDRHAIVDAPALRSKVLFSIAPPANLYDFSFLAPLPVLRG